MPRFVKSTDEPKPIEVRLTQDGHDDGSGDVNIYMNDTMVGWFGGRSGKLSLCRVDAEDRQALAALGVEFNEQGEIALEV